MAIVGNSKLVDKVNNIITDNYYDTNPTTGQRVSKVGGFDGYKKDAMEQYDASYNQKITNLKNQLAQNIASLNNSKTGINQNFDQQINKNNNYIKGTQNQVSNMALGRGLGRSSIVTSGINEQANIGARINDETNFSRNQSLSNVDNLISTAEQNTNNSLTDMANSREDAISALAKQMQKDAEAKQWQEILHQDDMYMQNKGWDFQKAMQEDQQSFTAEQNKIQQDFSRQMAQVEQNYKKELAKMGYDEASRERAWKSKEAELERSHNAKMQANSQAFQASQASKYGGSSGSYKNSSVDEYSLAMQELLKAKQALGQQPASTAPTKSANAMTVPKTIIGTNKPISPITQNLIKNSVFYK